jgi:hypothetical protein
LALDLSLSLLLRFGVSVAMVNDLKFEGTVVVFFLRLLALALFAVLMLLLRHSDQLVSEEDWSLIEGLINQLISWDLLKFLNALHLVLESCQIVLQK